MTNRDPRHLQPPDSAEQTSEHIRDEDTISLLDLIAVLAKRWKFIFFSTLFAALFIVGYSVYTIRMPYDAPFNKLPNVYKPEVLVRLQDESSSASASLLGGGDGLGALAGLAGISGAGGGSSVALAQELVKSNTIVDQIIERFGFINRYEFEEHPMPSARKMIREKLETEFDSESGILTISYTDVDPELATKIVNHAVTLLEARFRSLTMSKILNKKQFLEERLVEVEADLKQAQTELIEFQINNGIVNVVVDQETGSIELVFATYMQPTRRHAVTLEYFDLQRDKTILEGIYKLLMNQYETAKIEEMDDTKTFQILETAEVPEIKDGPSRAKVCMITTIAVFFLAVFLSFIFEYFSKARQDPEEAQKLETIRRSFFGGRKGRKENKKNRRQKKDTP